MTARHRSRLQVLEWVLASAGAACLAWYGVVTVRAVQYQRTQSSKLERGVTESPTILRTRTAKKSAHQLIGRLQIPRVHLSVMIVDGDDDDTLKVAAGHLPDTPLPWEFGNSAVAGHRDSFFRPLSGVKMNDRVTLTTPHGEFHYTVANLQVVEPNDLSVLTQAGHSSLTLVTCYPFAYVGRAPKRFIVRADHTPS
jgi:sortase A